MTDFQFLQLRGGAGKSYADGFCVMQAVAWLAGEDHTDAPECACPVLGKFAIRLNDMMKQEDRDRLLRPLIVPLTGTRSPKHEQARSEYIVRRVVREMVAPLFDHRWPDHAAALRAAETMAEVLAAAYAARDVYAPVFDLKKAVYELPNASAATASKARFVAVEAADCLARAAYYADVAYAATYAYAVNPALCADILRGAIMLGPNGLDAPPPELTDREQALREMVGACS